MVEWLYPVVSEEAGSFIFARKVRIPNFTRQIMKMLMFSLKT
jgi:hypothetical protein